MYGRFSDPERLLEGRGDTGLSVQGTAGETPLHPETQGGRPLVLERRGRPTLLGEGGATPPPQRGGGGGSPSPQRGGRGSTPKGGQGARRPLRRACPWVVNLLTCCFGSARLTIRAKG